MNNESKIAIIAKKNQLTSNKMLYVFNRTITGHYDKEKQVFVDEAGVSYPDVSIYENHLNNDDLFFIKADNLDTIKKIVKKATGKKLESLAELLPEYANIVCETTYVAELDSKNKKVIMDDLLIPDVKKELSKDIDDENSDVFGAVNFLDVIGEEEDVSNIKELLVTNLRDYNRISDYDRLMELKEKALQQYHEKSLLLTYLKCRMDNPDLFIAYEEEFKNCKSVKQLAYGLKMGIITEEELPLYVTATKNNLDNISSYINGIEYKTLYGKDTNDIRKKEQKELERTFITLNNIKNSNQMIDKIKETIISQDDAVVRLVAEMNQTFLLDDPREKTGILLTGSTGVGKTLLITTIADLLDRDVCIIDSSQLVINGYKGTSIEDALNKCYTSVNGDKHRLENAIIFFDEIDKKGLKSDSDVAGKGVLDSMLKFLDGTTYTMRDGVNIKTDNMLVIGGGSFSNVYQERVKNPIGFLGQREVHKVTDEDFLTYGNMTKEFMGRFATIIHLNDLTQEDFKRILLESDISPLKTQEKIFDKLGIKLVVDESYLDKASELAKERGLGARGLKGIVKNSVWQVFSDVSSNFNEIEEIHLTAETIEDNKNYEIVKKGKSLVKKK